MRGLYSWDLFSRRGELVCFVRRRNLLHVQSGSEQRDLRRVLGWDLFCDRCDVLPKLHTR